MNVFVCIVKSSAFGDYLSRIDKIFSTYTSALEWKRQYEIDIETKQSLIYPHFSKGNDEELDEYLYIKHEKEFGEKFICCEIEERQVYE